MDAGGRMQLGNHITKTQTKIQGKTQIPQSDLRLTVQKTAKQTANGARAQEEQPQKIYQGHSGKNPLAINSKPCSKRISSHPEK